ncbi:MAG: response regulator [Sandaracinaceae bacterium]|nr:response regulator [Sandaracinaceae bacterium]
MTNELRVLIADDEEMARLRVRRLLGELGQTSIVGEAASGKEALALLEDLDVDVALLDVRMGLVSGLDAAERAADLGVEVIITTAHREHAVEAFAHGAIDYLLKPIEGPRLAKALDRARARLVTSPAPPAASTALTTSARLPLEVRGEIVLVPIQAITHAVLEDTLVRVHAGSEAHLTELSLTDLERRLPHLFRAHRRALVSLDHVSRLRPLASGGYVAILRDGAEVPVSRQSARALRRQLGIG